jgi:membrane-bound lytic murein transglycosylase B
MLKRFPCLLLILIFGLACAQSADRPDSPAPEASTLPDPVGWAQETRAFLEKNGVPADFIEESELKYTRKKNWFRDSLKFLEPNLFGFLYHGNYLRHDSKRARRKTAGYLLAHQNSFRAAQKRFRVSPESIAALLWVETKLGTDMGRHPVPFVFYSIALASQPEVCKMVMDAIPAKLAASPLADKPDEATARKRVEERCKQKSEWAASEMKALALLHEKGKLDAFKLKGSFAGAFGIPQFLPSSYEKYAVSDYRKKPNLFLISDAILSVGSFLKRNGWKADSSDSQTQALYAYNRSKDYGTVILQIAEGLNGSREPEKPVTD